MCVCAGNPSIVLDIDYAETFQWLSQSIIIEYLVFGNPTPTFQEEPWSFGGGLIDDSTLLISEISSSFYFIFPLGAERSHSGDYTVVISSMAGVSSANFTLLVFSKPTSSGDTMPAHSSLD